ncbi:MAG: DegT/DnrJ/EryC1/StrS family aminotransferase [Candidatus Bathyarchaeota archaeon]|nr:DegT/DnrJ/EryC1/StrS family aminotransferase [Candidatus Bathyarchaeota archaeon]MDH5495630.1 DegT/DnrJ/EryC1/StrS family aminotransferase [Candidatus Bathyarchaeota archaeon]
MKMIPINKPLLGEEEVKAVAKVLRSGLLTSRTEGGSMVGRFEDAFARFVKAKHAVSVNSGTAALHLSLLASKVGHGSEVIVPSFTFVSTAETVVLVGAKPVFVDVNPDTYNIDAEKIGKAITKKTRAIIPVDLFGLPADMKPIREIAEEHDLVIIEDAAQAHGARYARKHAGSFADLACWSFYASKNMTTGEGGMITTSSDEYADKLPYMRTHGEKNEYVSSMIGGNFRMPEMEAAIGYTQLKKLPNFLKLRQRNAERLESKLRNVEELQLPIVPKGYKHSWYLFTVRLKNADKEKRNKIVGKLRKLNVGAMVYYRVPIHLMPFYRKFSNHRLPNTEKAAEQVFSLPVHPAVTIEEIDYIATSLSKVLRNHV